MNTYFVLDPDTNTWSPNHQPLKEIMSTPGVTGGHLLANAQTQETLTVAQALAASRKSALKAPTVPLLKLPPSAAAAGKAAGAAAAPRPTTERPHKSAVTQPLHRKKAPRSEYKVLRQRDECFDAPSLELVLNSYARQGWKVLSCMQSPANPLAEPKLSDLLIVMERRVARWRRFRLTYAAICGLIVPGGKPSHYQCYH